MSSGRLKVFRTLKQLFEQYRLYRRNEQGQIVKQNDELMNCLRHLCVSGRQQMRTAPKLELENRFISFAGKDGWMC